MEPQAKMYLISLNGDIKVCSRTPSLNTIVELCGTYMFHERIDLNESLNCNIFELLFNNQNVKQNAR